MADGSSGADVLDAAQEDAASGEQDGGDTVDAGLQAQPEAGMDARTEDAELADADSADTSLVSDAQPASDGTSPEASIEAGTDASLSVGDAGCGTAPSAIALSSAADIVLAVDTSLSLSPYLCGVITNLRRVAERIRVQGPNTRLVSVFAVGLPLQQVVTGICGTADLFDGSALTQDATRYKHVPFEIRSGEPLLALLATFDQYKGFLRPGVPTHFVVITDDDSQVTGPDFQTNMQQKLGHEFRFHAIVADGTDCLGAAIGTTFQQLADANLGLKLSICASDWSPLLACGAQ